MEREERDREGGEGEVDSVAQLEQGRRLAKAGPDYITRFGLWMTSSLKHRRRQKKQKTLFIVYSCRQQCAIRGSISVRSADVDDNCS